MSVPFKNNLLNTCCWLVETSQQVSVFFVNYKGRPWMKGMLENQALFLSILICVAMVAVCAWGVVPQINEWLNLVVVPEDLRWKVMSTLSLSLFGSFFWDRLMVYVFAKQIWGTMVEEAKATKLADFMPLLQTVGGVGAGLLLLVSGNPILWLLAFWFWRNHKNAAAQKSSAEAQALLAAAEAEGKAA